MLTDADNSSDLLKPVMETIKTRHEHGLPGRARGEGEEAAP